MDTVFEKAVQLLENKQSFALAVIIAEEGSTPRGEGSKMIITEDSIFATIGGGLLEAQIIEEARKRIIPEKCATVCAVDMYAKADATPDMICGGACEVLVAYVDGSDGNMLNVFKAAYNADKSGKKSWIFYIFDGNKNDFTCCVNIGGTEVVGEFEENEHFSREMLKNPVRVAVHGDFVDGWRITVHDINPNGRMYIFGGGHVSFEVAKLASHLGYPVTVIDDREEYANPERFPECDTVCIESFTDMQDFPTDERSYILIITRGHAHDKTVLKWALNKPCLYLGMIGSKTKRDALYVSLEKEGYSMEKMRQVKCPIGLSIGAETPSEIAVSIMAEVIAVTKGKVL
ncbi:MAG: XdhC family protein [Oscillospiraceae bacterium]|nr:XdhC family protein [Oscillospiraceae bacterium]